MHLFNFYSFFLSLEGKQVGTDLGATRNTVQTGQRGWTHLHLNKEQCPRRMGNFPSKRPFKMIKKSLFFNLILIEKDNGEAGD